MEENTLDWEEYEKITKYIYESLGAQYGIKVSGFGRHNKVTGTSGNKYQVDVLTEQNNGDQKIITAIECKYWKDKVDTDVILKLYSVMDDCDIANGIIVCKSGFTRDTMTYAEHKGIKLVILRESGEGDDEHGKDVELGFIDLNIHSTLTRANITSIDFGKKTVHFDPSIGAVYYWKLHDSSGNEFPLKPIMFEFADKVMRQNEPLKNITVDYPVEDGRLIYINGQELEVEKLSVTGFLSITNSKSVKSFTLKDQVWMIMEQLFDGKRLTLSKSGLIWNLPISSH